MPDPLTLATLTKEVEEEGTRNFGTQNNRSQRINKERIEERLFYHIFFKQLYTLPLTGEPFTPCSKGDSSPCSSPPSAARSRSASISAHPNHTAVTRANSFPPHATPTLRTRPDKAAPFSALPYFRDRPLALSPPSSPQARPNLIDIPELVPSRSSSPGPPPMIHSSTQNE